MRYLYYWINKYDSVVNSFRANKYMYYIYYESFVLASIAVLPILLLLWVIVTSPIWSVK